MPSVSRRNLFLGAGAIAAGAGASLGGSPVDAGWRPEVLGPVDPALTYLPIDALGFFTDSDTGINGRYSDNVSGTGSVNPNTRISYSLPIPVGSVIRQLNVSYMGNPIIEIFKRAFATPNPPTTPVQQTLPIGAGVQTFTLNLTAPVVIDPAAGYTLRFYLAAGSSVFGATVGYVPATQSFTPFSGPVPRVLDTREAGGKLAPNEERTVNLGFAGVRGAVLNLTVTATEGPMGGFVAVFPANIAWPGNSSINWSSPNQNVANGVITATDSSSQIKIRGGSANTHVVIDRIGWLI